MPDLNSPVWKELESEEVPALLRQLAEKPGVGFWSLLGDSLLDHGDVTPAGYAAFPHLIEIAIRRPVPDQVELWDFVGYIASQSPQAPRYLPNDVRNDYAMSVPKAKLPILQAILARAVHGTQTISLIQALASVSGCPGPGRILVEVLGGQDVDVRCPTCKRLLNIAFQDDGRSIRINANLTGRAVQISRDALPSDSTRCTPSADEIIPNRCSVWLPQIAEAGGCSRAAQRLRMLYQEVTCPDCGCTFPLMEELCKDATVNLDDSLDEEPQQETDPEKKEAIQRQIEEHTAQVNFFYKLETLPKPEIIRTLLDIAELELYEGSFSAETLSKAEIAIAAARDWLKKPSAAHEERARIAGSQALKHIAGAAATACGRMPELAAKTCVDALMSLSPELRKMAIARIQNLHGWN